MPNWSRVRALLVRLAWRIPWLCLFAVGVWILFRPAMHVFGRQLADLWVYSRSPQHRYTSMAMLTQSLSLHWSVGHAGHDEQVYNGAGFTNWGYGIPLLQLPFQAVGRHMRSLPQRFFPDRAIFFSYLALAIPIVWAGFDKLLASRERFGTTRRLRRHAVSWAATAFVLCTALYPMLASRFIIYEETVAYFAMVQLVAAAAFVFAVDERASVVAMALFGVVAGIGLLVRPTGLIYLGVWSGMLLLERRTWRTLISFAAGAMPFVVFWLVSNWVRTGSPWSSGYQNALPGYDMHIPMMRFGCQCSDTPKHAIQASLRLFSALFSLASDDPKPWMKDCHYDFEPHNGDEQFMSTQDPYVGVATLIFLVWTFAHHVGRRDVRIATYMPYIGCALVFGAYVYGVAGFAWRYIADFWPLFVAAGVQYVRRLPPASNAILGWPLAAAMLAGAVVCYHHDVVPWKPIVKTLEATEVPHMWDDFSNARWGTDKPMPSAVQCGQVPSWPWRNGRGWGSGCNVDTYSDVFVGVPRKDDDNYVIQFKTEGIAFDSVHVYVNGRNYVARRVGNTYSAPIRLHYGAMHSPLVLTTIGWTLGSEPPHGKLLEVQIL
ncbi:MAG TPA: hypothetical protein VMI75_26790 [Polyangiaceae bacterium]|nr:hypothetical protein [Polyangiaceae bacterium]